MLKSKLAALIFALAGASGSILGASAAGIARSDKINTIVVIYAENRSFDTLYGLFPGANGLNSVRTVQARQLDRDGSLLSELPPVWGGITNGVTPPVTQETTEQAHLPNAPSAIDTRFHLSLAEKIVSPVHRFYQNQMQINHGKNDKFVAWSDKGGLVMGYYDGSKLPLWRYARKYVLADNFFMGAFGGSFLNHFYLICACIPVYPNADQSPAQGHIASVSEDGVTLTLEADSPPSAANGIPKYANDGNLTPDFYAVNTMQPPYQPSGNPPAPARDQRYADPDNDSTLPPQAEITIGDLLSEKGVSWAWYAGAWQLALKGQGGGDVPDFQTHHQPFNYFLSMAPGTVARAAYLRDGGMNGELFIKDIDEGRLPQVTFYKPQGNLNEHPGYADVFSGDEHIANLIEHLEKSPQWPGMLVIVTYDENGGFWDHVAPPKADRWGPGNRIPALIISPFAKYGSVDHTLYDTSSIIRFIAAHHGLPVLRGIAMRDAALKANSEPPLGDLSAALNLGR
jgi:acid phosphatase